MHTVDGAEMLGILIRKLTENWSKLCDEYLDEEDPRPSFGVVPITQYIRWSKENIISNIKLISGEDEISVDGVHGALNAVFDQIDNTVLNGHPIIDDIIIIKHDDDTDEYNKAYTILAENLATIMVDVRVPELLLDYLYLCQKISIGRYLYEIRNVVTDDAVTGADMLNKLMMFGVQSQGEFLKVDKSDPLSRFEIVTYNRKALEYVGIGADHVRSTFNAYNKAIERSRTFYVPDEIYNS